MSSSERDTAMSRSALGHRDSERATLPAMLAQDSETKRAYAPDGPRRMVGRATLVAHLRTTLARFIFTVERERRNTIRLSL